MGVYVLQGVHRIVDACAVSNPSADPLIIARCHAHDAIAATTCCHDGARDPATSALTNWLPCACEFTAAQDHAEHIHLACGQVFEAVSIVDNMYVSCMPTSMTALQCRMGYSCACASGVVVCYGQSSVVG